MMSGKKKTRGRNQQQSIDAHDRMLQALELRKAGVGYQKIADALGFANASGAFKAVDRALHQVQVEAASELLALELERLDAMMTAITPAVRAGNFGAIDRALRIMERRARYLGLDAATQVDLKQSAVHVFTLQIGDKVIELGNNESNESNEKSKNKKLKNDFTSHEREDVSDVDDDLAEVIDAEVVEIIESDEMKDG